MLPTLTRGKTHFKCKSYMYLPQIFIYYIFLIIIINILFPRNITYNF